MISLHPLKSFEDPKIQSASGLLNFQDSLFLICDTDFGIYQRSLSECWTYHPWPQAPLLAGSHSEIKKRKPDYECLIRSPYDQNEIIAFPSGSTPERQIGLIFNLKTQKIRTHDFSKLFKSMSSHTAQINIEGCVIHQNQFLLLNRGSGEFLTEIFQMTIDNFEVTRQQSVHFEKIQGITTHGTELHLFQDKLYALFCAENTLDSYNDGEILGSGLAEIDLSSLEVLSCELFDKTIKGEGLSPWKNQWILCTDPDGFGPSEFYQFKI